MSFDPRWTRVEVGAGWRLTLVVGYKRGNRRFLHNVLHQEHQEAAI